MLKVLVDTFHKIENLWKFRLTFGSSNFKRIMKEQTPLGLILLHYFRCILKGFRFEVFYNLRGQFLSLENYVVSEGAVSHNV